MRWRVLLSLAWLDLDACLRFQTLFCVNLAPSLEYFPFLKIPLLEIISHV